MKVLNSHPMSSGSLNLVHSVKSGLERFRLNSEAEVFNRSANATPVHPRLQLSGDMEAGKGGNFGVSGDVTIS